MPVPPKVIPVTAHEATVAVAVTVDGQALLSVTAGAVVYPVPPLVMVAWSRLHVVLDVHGPDESL